MSASTIKKVFEPMIALLVSNQTATVSDILAQATKLASKSTSSVAAAFHAAADGSALIAHCAYFDQYFIVSEQEFGVKASAKSGLNSYCKEGLALFNKQQSTAKADEAGLLTKLMAGELLPEDIGTAKNEIEEARLVVADTEQRGFDTLEAAITALEG
ncbi:MAG: hypothetical protein HRU18_06925 [Pseudoalteromonas sp.]|uniref:hypothetical protein n=1 Tax=Pseudoalteromonas sp. TaxID=53249 RepID=UPI001D63F675|nr:hypothetical protein [Pseudoalteromonas sp.]NRA77924.1 hypothetical protein [Pseudoalteromonas sp.]